jgi:hypothetical protein
MSKIVLHTHRRPIAQLCAYKKGHECEGPIIFHNLPVVKKILNDVLISQVL